MKYQQPVGGAADDPYVTGNPATDTDGSIPPGEAIEHPMREIINTIIAAGLIPSQGDLTQLSQAVSLIALSVGTVVATARQATPSGFLKCNGAAISRSSYAPLFSAIGVTFGSGDGSTTFNLPDLRSEFIRGFDDGRGVDSGRVFGSAQTEDFKSHSHDVYIARNINNTGVADDIGERAARSSSSVAHGVFASSLAGGSETRPRNIALNFLIKY